MRTLSDRAHRVVIAVLCVLVSCGDRADVDVQHLTGLPPIADHRNYCGELPDGCSWRMSAHTNGKTIYETLCADGTSERIEWRAE
jgi:hypothetical protein